ncbi:hypothetical protein C8F01DRAFT_1083750 [Mycena amicta]|nr:hypothetical protein C8F01DRAFT_1083750 [Mycena amicta]
MQQDELNASLRHPVGDTDTEMIEYTLMDVSEAARRKFTFKPIQTGPSAPPPKRSRKPKPKPNSTSSTSSAKSTITISYDETSDAPSKKKKSKNNELMEEEEDEGLFSQPTAKISGYAMVEKDLPVVRGKGQPKARKMTADSPDYISKGPFYFTSHDSSDEFRNQMAKVLPCPITNLQMDTAKWKPLKPASAPALPLTNEAEYNEWLQRCSRKILRSVLCRSTWLRRRSQSWLMLLQPWDTGMEEEEEDSKFDYSQVEHPLASGSFNEQKAGGRYFDMDEVGRMTVWAKAIAEHRTDQHTPPWDSRFFNDKQKMKIPRNIPSPPAAPLTAAPAIPPAAPAPPTLMSDILMMSLLAQTCMLPTNGTQFQFPFGVPAPAPASHSALASPVKRHKVTIEQFVQEYGLDAKDGVRLDEMEVRPGDRISAELSEDAKQAGFKLLSWSRVCDANLQFKADLKDGKFKIPF